MEAQATHTKPLRRVYYVPASSRAARDTTTFHSEVADKGRGTRIRERREALHLTQPAVVEALEAAARALPPEHELHPGKAGKAPVTLRGYQTYERGGGIVWEKAKLLAQVLGMDVHVMMSGERRERETPDPFPARRNGGEDTLTRIEARLDDHAAKVENMLAAQTRALQGIESLLARIEAAISAQEAAASREDASRERLLAAADDAARALRDATRLPAAEHDTQAK
jgi:transcriptional regulator with XRE-family HTH domain